MSQLILKLCVKDSIFSSYHSLAEVTFQWTHGLVPSCFVALCCSILLLKSAKYVLFIARRRVPSGEYFTSSSFYKFHHERSSEWNNRKVLRVVDYVPISCVRTIRQLIYRYFLVVKPSLLLLNIRRFITFLTGCFWFFLSRTLTL